MGKKQFKQLIVSRFGAAPFKTIRIHINKKKNVCKKKNICMATLLQIKYMYNKQDLKKKNIKGEKNITKKSPST